MNALRDWWRRITAGRYETPSMPLSDIRRADRLVAQSIYHRARVRTQMTLLEQRLIALRREEEERQ